MIRRSVLALGAVLAIAGLSSCTSVSRADTAAKFGSESLTVTELGALAPGITEGDTLRNAISAWVTLGVLDGDVSGTITPTDLKARLEKAEHALFAPIVASAYAKGLDAPLVCLGAIPLAAGTSVDAVLAERTAGATWAALATKYSTDSTLAGNGGIIPDSSGNDCQDISGINATLLPLLTAAKPTVGTPFNISYNGQDIIFILRPIEEVPATQIIRFAPDASRAAFLAKLANAKSVYVNPRYGRWDLTTGSVVALST